MSAGVKEAHQYAIDVVGGEIVACKYIKQACQRYLDDLETAEERGFYFDKDEAQAICDFYPLFTRHIKGPLAGQPILLEPWQAFGLVNIFGWKHTDTNLRRFRTVYEEVARKNAKSTKVSGVGLYLAGFDDEGGAEVYSCATTKDQARIVFNDARHMVQASPELRRVFGVYRNNIHTKTGASKFEPLSSDANTLDGLNVHGGLIDEVHAHKTREVWDVIETATGSRLQSILYGISTAGSNKMGICYELRTYAAKILDGIVEDDTFFALIYTLDEDDDWQDETNWIKANPNLGVSKNLDDMQRLAKKAKEMPTARANFLTKHLNVWVNSANSWMNMEKWDKCRGIAPDEELANMPCWIGLDLANKLDIAAMVMVFVDANQNLHVKCHFYLPEEQIEVKSRTIGNMYQSWADSGYLTLTPGNVIDHDYIEEDIRAVCSEYDVQEIAFDPWGGTQLSIALERDGFEMVEVGQTVKNLSEAMKETEANVFAGRLHHGDNPVLNWMASNIEVTVDRNENIFPRKADDHADNKIDGMVALFMATLRIIGQNENPLSPWEQEGYTVAGD